MKYYVNKNDSSNSSAIRKVSSSAGKYKPGEHFETVDKLEQQHIDMVQKESINDGADEQMLRTEEAKLSQKRDEVKFIKGDQQNGDAKIDIGAVNAKAFTGMTKEELMKYANDPFWVRLRWIFFVAFWAIWVGMLVGAILIIVDAPKCAAPATLSWFKRGFLSKFSAVVGTDDTTLSEKLHATGVIYELPPELTYSVREKAVEEEIKNIIATYKDSLAHVIMDITPNYVPKDSRLVREALTDESKRAAFIWVEKPEVPNNWLSITNGSAWTELQPGNFVLSQFGDGFYDLHMNDSIVKSELSDVLKHLVELGVGGIRLKNTKFFLLSKNLQDEIPSSDANYIHTQYGFWTHSQTTFQEGLGDLLSEYRFVVKNASADAFLSVSESLVRPEVYQTNLGDCAVDIPMYGRLPQALKSADGKKIYTELQNALHTACNDSWLQWDLTDVSYEDYASPSALVLFISLLPGVPVVPMNSVALTNISADVYKHVEQLRLSPSYMHGDFNVQESNGLIAYTRIKSGNPGYFVLFNPTDEIRKANFTQLGLPDKMTVDAISENFEVNDITPKSKVMSDDLEVSAHATIIFTYVPIKAN